MPNKLKKGRRRVGVPTDSSFFKWFSIYENIWNFLRHIHLNFDMKIRKKLTFWTPMYRDGHAGENSI